MVHIEDPYVVVISWTLSVKIEQSFPFLVIILFYSINLVHPANIFLTIMNWTTIPCQNHIRILIQEVCNFHE